MNDKQNIEIEYKFRVEDKGRLVSLLDREPGNRVPRQYQSSVMFDSSGLMEATDSRIRVRTLGESGEKTLTYKRPLPAENGVKREIEYEIRFFDPANQIEKILEVMQFLPTTSYERYQTRWEIGNAHVTLDEYPFADFVEIEGPAEEIEAVARRLGLNTREGLTQPVDTLYQEWRRRRGLPFKPHMRFDDFDE